MALAAMGAATAAHAEPGTDSTVFINEIHYDNTGTDTGELVEVAGPAATDLSGWSIVLYNGSNGTSYGSIALAGVLPDQSGGYGTLVENLPVNGLQNGSPDGLALIDAVGSVVQFLSYEGSFTAAGGPAAGLTSTDIGVVEGSSTPVGESLQLTGSGATAGDFTWVGPAAESPGAPNGGQSFVPVSAGSDPVINEFSASTSGPDVEYVEILGDAATDYSAYTVLEIEGDGANAGVIDGAFAVGTTDAAGFHLISLAPNELENGTITLLLVEGFTGAAGDDLDPDDDGVLDLAPWGRVVDGVGVDDGDAGDRTYAEVALDQFFDDARVDNGFPPGAASRFPDGTDTDTAADWFRNDFSPDNGSPEPGEALNTPGAPNELVPVPPPEVFISELHYDNAGADVGEFVEVAGDAGADLTGWSVVLYNGSTGQVYDTIALAGAIDDEGSGQGAVSFLPPGGSIQNGSPDGLALVDPSGAVVEFLSYEGDFTAADGPAAGQTSVDIGVAEGSSTPVGQSLQLIAGVWTGPAAESPGDLNAAGGGPQRTLISAIQGSGSASPLAGREVIIEGIVVGDFQQIVTADPVGDEPLGGFFVQEEDVDADGDSATSEGIFVFAPSAIDVSVGDLVEVTGTVTEFFGLTELSNVTGLSVVSSGNPLPTPAAPVLPTRTGEPGVDWEAIEGMSVSFGQPLYVTGLFPLGAFGEVQLSAIGPQDHPNQTNPVGSQAAIDQRQLNLDSRVILDDGEDENESFPSGLSTWNPEPTPYLGGPENTLRSGDVVSNLFGVVFYAFGEYEVQPVNVSDPTDPDGAVRITRTPRPTSVPQVGGSLRVASFNVLNYFTTIDTGGAQCGPPGFEQGCRGADTAAEFDLQSAKIADAISDLDADIVGLIELENSANDEAIADLVTKVNARSARTYDYIATGYIGTDAIAVGFIYDVATVRPRGPFAVLDSSVSPAFIDDENRPALAQTFAETASGATLTVAVNHLKSKGSACDDVVNPGDPLFGVAPFSAGDDVEDPSFQGNCNLTRTTAAKVLGQWLAGNPTGTRSENLLVLGDLNAYANEDPITELELQGYTDLQELFAGGNAWALGGHSYVFDGEHGALDYAMANRALLDQVTGAAAWHINADEPFAIDYQSFNPPGQATPDEWKSSDHDPVLVGLALRPPTPRCHGREATIVGTDGDDVLFGTHGDDVIVALGGHDRVFGLDGDDVICLGDGNDAAFGGRGDDIILGEGGRDLVYGALGRDTIDGGDDLDWIHGDGGDDILSGGAGLDWVHGGLGDDQLFGRDGPDFLFGGRGRDHLDGGAGFDFGDGGPGRDTCVDVELNRRCGS